MSEPPDSDLHARIGLCLTCVHSRRVETPRSTFWMCLLHRTDRRFPKYPRLPVVACSGYEPAPPHLAKNDEGEAQRGDV